MKQPWVKSSSLKISCAGLGLIALFSSNIVIHLVVIVLLVAIAFSRLKELQSVKFWLIFAIITFLPNLFLRSAEIWRLSSLVFTRSVIMYLSLLTIAENIHLDTVNRYLPKIFGQSLAVSITLAFNLIPVIRKILLRSYLLNYFKKKNGCSKLRQIVNFSLSIFKQVLNAADDCAENMIVTHKSAVPYLIIITGEKHSGKTTRAAKLVEKFKMQGWPVSGVLAPSLMKDNRRVLINVQNVATDEVKFLAARDQKVADMEYGYGGFSFSQAGYAFARSALMNYLPGGIVFLDEFGPLEFAGQGYAEEFKILMRANIATLVIVVRKELLEHFKSEAKVSFYEVIEVDHDFAATVESLDGNV